MTKTIKWITCAVFFTLPALFMDAKAQTTELKFTYDNAGNQIKREFVCANCITPFPQAFVATVPDESGKPEEPKNSVKKPRTVTGYPNPLTEVLNLKWDTSDKYHISKVEVISQTGMSVFRQEFGTAATYLAQTTVSFQKQIPGTYLVKVSYSDGKQVVIKVVKI